MSASRGVVEVITTKRVAMKMSASDIPTPSSAVTSGSPAAMNEPNVKISTTSAIRMPSSSVMLMPVTDCENSWPPIDTCDPAGRALCRSVLAFCSAVMVESVASLCTTESWIGISAADASELMLPDVVEAYGEVADETWGDLLDAGDRRFDRALDLGLPNGAALRGDHDHLCRSAADLRKRASEGVERVL